MVEGGGVGLLPALCLLLMAWVLLTLLTDSCLSPSSGAIAAEQLSVTCMVIEDTKQRCIVADEICQLFSNTFLTSIRKVS